MERRRGENDPGFGANILTGVLRTPERASLLVSNFLSLRPVPGNGRVVDVPWQQAGRIRRTGAANRNAGSLQIRSDYRRPELPGLGEGIETLVQKPAGLLDDRPPRRSPRRRMTN